MTVITPSDAVPFVSSADMLAALTEVARTAEAAGVDAYNRGDHDVAGAYWLASAAYWLDVAAIHERIADLPCFTVAKDVTA